MNKTERKPLIKTDFMTSQSIDFDAIVVKATVYKTSKPKRGNPYKPWTPKTGVSLIMKTAGGRMVQIRRVLPVDSTSQLLTLAKGDRVTCKGWQINSTNELSDGTSLYEMSEASPFFRPTIEKSNETKEGN